MNYTHCITLSILILTCPTPSYSAGIPVFDASNMAQNTLTAVEAITQTMKQLEQYTLQLQQYEDQIKNSLAPPAYVWDQAQRTMNKVIQLQDQLDFYTQKAGNTDNYLQKFGNVNTYRDSPYFGASGSSAAQRNSLLESEQLGSEAQKHANDNMTRTLEQQREALREDAANLERLQSNAQSAQGRLEAIQYANQFASHQSNQMLQIRALLMAQQAAENARAQTITAREARQKAADEKALESTYRKSPERGWKPF